VPGNANISDISPILGVLDAISTVIFRPLESHLLTVSGVRHFEDPEESDSEGNNTEVTEDKSSLPVETQPRVATRDYSIKLTTHIPQHP